MKLRGLICCFASALLTAGALRVPALDPAREIAQYSRQQWQSREGLPQNSVRAMAMTPDGYLWLGTEEGLARFDGWRFEIFDGYNTPQLGGGVINTLFADPDGALWIGHAQGAAVWVGGRFTALDGPGGLPAAKVNAFARDSAGALYGGTETGLYRRDHERWRPLDQEAGAHAAGPGAAEILALAAGGDGALWIGTRGAGLFLFADGRYTRYGMAQGLPSPVINSLRVDRQGGLWAGTEAGLAQRRGEKFAPAPGAPAGLNVTAQFADREGNLWLGSSGQGLCRLNPPPSGPSAVCMNRRTGDWPGDYVDAFLEDGRGGLWVGTDGAGLVRLSDGLFTPLDERQGLSGNLIRVILEDRDGAVWIGTSATGLNRVKDGVITRYSQNDGLLGRTVWGLAQGPDGALWIATNGGLNVMRGGKIGGYTTRDGLSSPRVTELLADADGRLWVGTEAGLDLFADGKFTPFGSARGLPGDKVQSLYRDPRGTLWIGFTHALFQENAGRFVPVPLGPEPPRALRVLHGDAEGTLWIGTVGGGLLRLKAGKLSRLTHADGLAADSALAILEDGAHRVWLTSNRGVQRIALAALNRRADGDAAPLLPEAFGFADGLRTTEFNGGSQRAGMIARDGRLWLPTIAGVMIADPRHERPRAPPPPARLESMSADQQPVDASITDARLAPQTRGVAFAFTALEFADPQQVRFRYRLAGFDDNWVDAGARREAFYTNLRPGHYRFEVAATLGGGQWGEAAVRAFNIPQRLYQNRLAQVAAGLLLLLLAILYLRMRVSALQRSRLRLQREVDARTAELGAANRALQALSTTDALTGLANRRAFDDALDSEWRRAIRARQPVALLIVDLDQFKAYNDRYGHAAGDEVLKAAAAALREQFNRAGDTAARWGGEEFAILLTGLDAGGAARIAEALRLRVEDLRLGHAAAPGGIVTVSIGVASQQPVIEGDAARLFAAADRALYEAKRLGRNRVV